MGTGSFEGRTRALLKELRAAAGSNDVLIKVDWERVIFDMLTIKGIYGRGMYEIWCMMTVMVQSGLDIGPVITHRLPCAEFEAGFQAMRRGDRGKVVLYWQNEP